MSDFGDRLNKLIAENEQLRAEIKRVTAERDQAREEVGFQKGLKESIRGELNNFIRLWRGLKDELEGLKKDDSTDD